MVEYIANIDIIGNNFLKFLVVFVMSVSRLMLGSCLMACNRALIAFYALGRINVIKAKGARMTVVDFLNFRAKKCYLM